MFLEQMVVCPIAYAAWDIPFPALLRGSSPSQIPDEIRRKLGPLLWANAKVWTPVNVITYNLPSEWRLLFCSVMDLVWQSVNSRITSEDIIVVEGEEGQSAADESIMSTTLSSSSSSSRPAVHRVVRRWICLKIPRETPLGDGRPLSRGWYHETSE